MHTDNMGKLPLISVIMPVYNCEKYVAQAIESILQQSLPDFELLIADDGSNDRSKLIIDQYITQDSRIITSHNRTNQGKVPTVNRLLAQCRGRYITIHDADDFSDVTRFEKQIDTLDRNGDMAMCGTSFYLIDSKGKTIEKKTMRDDYMEITRNLYEESQFHGPTMMFKKDIISMVGGLYRDYFFVAEDNDFSERIVEKFLAINLTSPLYYYRLHRKSLTKRFDLYTPERYALIDLSKRLREERRSFGTDSLWGNKNNEELDDYYYLKVAEWGRKREHIYYDGIQRSIYFKFYKDAVILSIKSILFRPLNLRSYRTLVYVLKKYFESVFKGNPVSV